MNDVCPSSLCELYGKMMLATPMMTATPNDVCLTAHWANIASLAKRSGATSYLRSKCIISPQGDASFEDIQGLLLDFS